MAERRQVALTLSVVVVLAMVAVGTLRLVGGAVAAGNGPSHEGVLERIRPVGQLNTGAPITLPAPGTPAVAATPVSTPAPATGSAASGPAAPAKAAGRTGEQVFSTVCFACHGTGAAGAPKVGDKAAWAPRIKQGNAVLVQHALQGFTGKTGVMPPRGTCGNCSDQELKSAVEYMVSKAK